MQEELSHYRRHADALIAQHRAAVAGARQAKQMLADAQAHLEDALAAQQIAQQIAATVQQQAHTRIAAVVTRCLAAVFPDDPYQFQITFDRKRGKTEAVLQLVRDGMVLSDPLNEAGGGVVAVAAVALRIAAILLVRPPCRRLLVADEPLAMLHNPAAAARFWDLLVRLAAETGMQILIATGAEEGLRAGDVVVLE